MNSADNTQASFPRTILCWGRSDPDYSRIRILRQVLGEFGWRIEFFRPRFSPTGDLEAGLAGIPRPDLVWVPCFRQRDIPAAARYCRRHGIPLLTDPLISAYDKQVFERGKFSAASRRGLRLKRQETQLLGRADCVLADTEAHAAFFRDVLGVSGDRIRVVPVGAEEDLFGPRPLPLRKPGEPLEALFFGSFIPLQGPQVIVEAARRYQGPPVVWRLVGAGPLLGECRERATDLPQIEFEDWVPYPELPARIARADILLGIFGVTPKAARVVPNKVYQAAACGRPLVTMRSAAYPPELLAQENSGFSWVPPGDPAALAAAVAALAAERGSLPRHGAAARASYEKYLSVAHIRKQLAAALTSLGLQPETHGNG
jgi:glycosyltransferase involved in cell wall biosynthesis